MKKIRVIFIFIGLLLITLLGEGSYLYFHQMILSKEPYENSTIFCYVTINYGVLNNNSIENYNVTMKPGDTAYDAFNSVVDLDVKYYPFGIYIKGVNGYEEKPPGYWAFYYYNSSSDKWIYSEVGVSSYFLHDGDSVKLSYHS